MDINLSTHYYWRSNITVGKLSTLCLKKNPCDYVFDDNLNGKRPIVIIFRTVITYTIGHRKVVSLSHFTYFVQTALPWEFVEPENS